MTPEMYKKPEVKKAAVDEKPAKKETVVVPKKAKSKSKPKRE